MIRAVIVEDEPLAMRFLESLLTATGKVEVIGRAPNADWAMTVCSDFAPDAVFLDVRMPGDDGFALAKRLALLPSPPAIVFTTALPERAFEAFRLQAVDYLVKPLDESQVREAVDRLIVAIAADTPSSKLPPTEERLPVKCLQDDIVKFIPKQDIVAAISCGRRTWIHTMDGKFPTYYPLDRLMTWFGDAAFVRVSRQGIVNLRAIEEVVHYGDRLYQIRLKDRERTHITASRSGARILARLLEPPV